MALIGILVWVTIEIGQVVDGAPTPSQLEAEAERLESGFAPAAGKN